MKNRVFRCSTHSLPSSPGHHAIPPARIASGWPLIPKGQTGKDERLWPRNHSSSHFWISAILGEAAMRGRSWRQRQSGAGALPAGPQPVPGPDSQQVRAKFLQGRGTHLSRHNCLSLSRFCWANRSACQPATTPDSVAETSIHTKLLTSVDFPFAGAAVPCPAARTRVDRPIPSTFLHSPTLAENGIFLATAWPGERFPSLPHGRAARRWANRT